MWFLRIFEPFLVPFLDLFLDCCRRGWQALLKRPLIEASALQWKMTVAAILQSSTELPEAQYLEVKYEDFVERPVEILEQVGKKCSLIWPGDLLQAITAGIENRNFKWQTEMQIADKETLNHLLGDFIRQLGYDIGHTPNTQCNHDTQPNN